jgi:hypothetical protein
MTEKRSALVSVGWITIRVCTKLLTVSDFCKAGLSLTVVVLLAIIDNGTAPGVGGWETSRTPASKTESKMILYFSKNTEAPGLDTTRVLSDAPPHRWTSADLFFLRDSLRHGMSVLEVAGFLRRTEDEVRQKAKELNYLNAAGDLIRRQVELKTYRKGLRLNSLRCKGLTVPSPAIPSVGKCARIVSAT